MVYSDSLNQAAFFGGGFSTSISIASKLLPNWGNSTEFSHFALLCDKCSEGVFPVTVNLLVVLLLPHSSPLPVPPPVPQSPVHIPKLYPLPSIQPFSSCLSLLSHTLASSVINHSSEDSRHSPSPCSGFLLYSPTRCSLSHTLSSPEWERWGVCVRRLTLHHTLAFCVNVHGCLHNPHNHIHCFAS